MNSDSSARSFVHAALLDGDWDVDGHPLVADGIDPEETVEVDRFRCVACDRPLDVHLGLSQDEAILLSDSTWRAAGFRALESIAGRPPLQVDGRGLQAITRRVTCGTCDAEQVAIAAGGEWQPQRLVIVAHGTAPVIDPGSRWSTRIAAGVLAALLLALAWVNVAAVREAAAERRVARDGQRIEARVLEATESGGGPRMVASHHLRLTWRDPDRIERDVEVDFATFVRYADAHVAPIRVRDGHVTVEGDHEQRNDLVAVLVIDATILLTIAGIALFAWCDLRGVSRR